MWPSDGTTVACRHHSPLYRPRTHALQEDTAYVPITDQFGELAQLWSEAGANRELQDRVRWDHYLEHFKAFQYLFQREQDEQNAEVLLLPSQESSPTGKWRVALFGHAGNAWCLHPTLTADV